MLMPNGQESVNQAGHSITHALETTAQLYWSWSTLLELINQWNTWGI